MNPRVKLKKNCLKAQVLSSDGSTYYNVQYKGSGDMEPDYGGIWECDCPAGQHGRMCRHVKLVSNIIDDMEGYEPENYLHEFETGEFILVDEL